MTAPPQLEQSWAEALKDEWSKPYMSKLVQFIAEERCEYVVYPRPENVFAAFNATCYEQTKVVIVGQDPYHGDRQAHGLSFSVPEGVRQPPSLKNIFKEIKSDLGISMSESGCLTNWANQGVLMLNATLTVRAKSPGSHRGKGWELFTDCVIEQLCKKQEPIIFVLWGRFAQEKCSKILGGSNGRHHVLISPHPSPYSAHSGFFGSCHFSKINELLKRQGKEPINWTV